MFGPVAIGELLDTFNVEDPDVSGVLRNTSEMMKNFIFEENSLVYTYSYYNL